MKVIRALLSQMSSNTHIDKQLHTTIDRYMRRYKNKFIFSFRIKSFFSKAFSNACVTFKYFYQVIMSIIDCHSYTYATDINYVIMTIIQHQLSMALATVPACLHSSESSWNWWMHMAVPLSSDHTQAQFKMMQTESESVTIY